jgi:hypothetical protein
MGNSWSPLWYLTVATNFDAQLGLLREAERNWELISQISLIRQLACATKILETYYSRKDDQLRKKLREKDARYMLDWYSLPQY